MYLDVCVRQTNTYAILLLLMCSHQSLENVIACPEAEATLLNPN